LRVQTPHLMAESCAPDGAIGMQREGVATGAAMALCRPRIDVESNARILLVEGVGVVAEPTLVRPVGGPQNALTIDLRIAEPLTVGWRGPRGNFYFGEIIGRRIEADQEARAFRRPGYALRVGGNIVRLGKAARQVERHDAILRRSAGHCVI